MPFAILSATRRGASIGLDPSGATSWASMSFTRSAWLAVVEPWSRALRNRRRPCIPRSFTHSVRASISGLCGALPTSTAPACGASMTFRMGLSVAWTESRKSPNAFGDRSRIMSTPSSAVRRTASSLRSRRRLSPFSIFLPTFCGVHLTTLTELSRAASTPSES